MNSVQHAILHRQEFHTYNLNLKFCATKTKVQLDPKISWLSFSNGEGWFSTPTLRLLLKSLNIITPTLLEHTLEVYCSKYSILKNLQGTRFMPHIQLIKWHGPVFEFNCHKHY